MVSQRLFGGLGMKVASRGSGRDKEGGLTIHYPIFICPFTRPLCNVHAHPSVLGCTAPARPEPHPACICWAPVWAAHPLPPILPTPTPLSCRPEELPAGCSVLCSLFVGCVRSWPGEVRCSVHMLCQNWDPHAFSLPRVLIAHTAPVHV